MKKYKSLYEAKTEKDLIINFLKKNGCSIEIKTNEHGDRITATTKSGAKLIFQTFKKDNDSIGSASYNDDILGFGSINILRGYKGILNQIKSFL